MRIIRWIILMALFCINLYGIENSLSYPQKVVFKNLVEGDTVLYDIVVKNNANKLVKIQSVQSSCKCTVLKFNPVELRPADSVIIPVQIVTDGFYGRVLRSVTIRTSDQNKPKISVIFEMHVKSELGMQPRFLDFQKIQPDKISQQWVLLTNNTDHPIEIERIETDEKILKIDYKPVVLKPSDSVKVKFSIQPPEHFQSYTIVYIHLAGARLPLVKLPAYIRTEE